jgi:adenosylcobinamide-GDP ribazoletransferase
LPPARADGLAATAADPPLLRGLAAIAMGGLVLLICPLKSALVALGATAVVAALMIRLMHRQIEGYTGDGLGATEQKIEGAVLAAIVAMAT